MNEIFTHLFSITVFTLTLSIIMESFIQINMVQFGLSYVLKSHMGEFSNICGYNSTPKVAAFLTNSADPDEEKHFLQHFI